MAKKRVIAYWMHEHERDFVMPLFGPGAQVTDSFAVGEIDEGDISKARAAGLIVQEQRPAPERGREAERSVFRMRRHDASDARLLAAAGRVPAKVDYYVLDLNVPLLDQQRDLLDRAGVTFMEALPDGGYKIRLKAADYARVRAVPGVLRVTFIEPPEAAPVRITAFSAPFAESQRSVEMLPFDIRLNDPDDRSKIEDYLKNRNAAVAGSSGRKIRFWAFEDDRIVRDLLALPEVDSVVEYVLPTPSADAARRLLGVDAAVSGAPPPGVPLDGTGEIIAIADTGIDDAHPDFAGRIRAAVARGRAGDASDPDGHGTHVAGCAAGDGTASGGILKGVAPKAELFFQSLLDARGKLGGLPFDLNDLFLEAYAAGARIHNDSWGIENSKSRYAIDSEEVDRFVYTHPDMLVVIAGGNDGKAAAPARSAPGFVDWLSITAPGSSKNAITVGASRSDRADGAYSQRTWGAAFPSNFPVAPIAAQLISGDPQSLAGFSSRGPTDDRRIKPDVVAPGTDIASTRSSKAPLFNFWGPYPATHGTPPNPHYAYRGGTSMAAPFVAGCAALLRQYFRTHRQHEPSAALLKATLVNSTVWLTGADATAPAAGTPNYHQGHGRVDMARAIPNASRPNLVLEFSDDWTPGSGLKTGQNARFQVTVPDGCEEFRACLTFTDPPARGLQNNLNVVVQRGGDVRKYLGNEAVPDALSLPDTTNNLECVRIPKPPAGVYYIQVMASNVLKAPQAFALVVTGDGLSGFGPY